MDKNHSIIKDAERKRGQHLRAQERGTPEYSGRGRKPGCSAKRGAAAYKKNRSRCHRPKTVFMDSDFIRWMGKKVRKNNWSFHAI